MGSWSRRQRVLQARRILDRLGCKQTILYIWRPSFAGVLDVVPHDLSCYHIDDEYSFSSIETPVDPAEARLAARVDQVFIHSPALLRKKGHLNPHTLFVPNGVDYQAFSTPRCEPDDLARVPHPRIGYVGRIKAQLDLDLLRTLAERHADWSFVMVGPVEIPEHDPQRRALMKRRNIHFLGPKPVDRLPAYAQHVDVGMLCYDVNGYTKYIYPLKLHEYLATGRPVVGTPIESLTEFADIIRLARTPQEWSDALRESLTGGASSAAAVERRQQVARRHDWTRLVTDLASALGTRLGEPYRERVTTAAAATGWSADVAGMTRH